MTAWIIRDALLIDPNADAPLSGDLVLRDGAIAQVGGVASSLAGARVVHAQGLALAPAMVDAMVDAQHDVAALGQTALAAGVATAALAPSEACLLDEPARVEALALRAQAQTAARLLPMANLTRGGEGARMADLTLLRDAGAVAFCDGARAIADSSLMRLVFAYAKALDRPAFAYAEDPSLAEDGVAHEGAIASRMGLASLPWVAETIGASRDIALAGALGAACRLAAVSSRHTLALVRAAQAQGSDVACMVSAHHLILDARAVEGYRTAAKLAPPLRDEADSLALAQGVRDGVIGVIASRHSAAAPDAKARTFAQASFGAPGLATLLPGALTLHHNPDIGLSLNALFRVLARNPAAMLGLAQGRLEAGAPADLVLFDPQAAQTIDDPASPLCGRTLRGQVMATFVDGNAAFARAPLEGWLA